MKLVFDEFHFRYGDMSSYTYGFIIAHLDTDSYDNMIGETETVTVFNRRNHKRYFVEDRYDSSPIEFEIEMVVCDHEKYPLHVRRNFENAMFYSRSYQPFYIELEDDKYGETYEVIDGQTVRSYLMARFVNPSRIEDGAGRTVGYKCTLQCDSPMMHQDTIQKELDVDEQRATVTVDSDVPGYIYPKMTIQVGSTGGTIQLYNTADDSERLTTLENVTAGEKIVIDSDINYISGSNYTKFKDKNFPRLVSGENYIYHTGDISSITVEYSNRRYL